ncbi:hypothetical protein COB87_000240 [Candidatus Wolfebacteria bacterium]|nr:hypothetical protein [Candidatus Wolfebacteria bacterium]
MTDVTSFFLIIQNLPIASIATTIIAIIWIFFSFSITYHWVVYSRNIIISAVVLALYYGVSLFLIGSILTKIAYV